MPNENKTEFVRDVDLKRYLPKYILDYPQMYDLYNAENPEFRWLLERINKAIDSEFIVSTDEQIRIFEGYLHIRPSAGDDLETRKRRVLLRWNDTKPYTYKRLLEVLAELCEGDNFESNPDWNNYWLYITTHLQKAGLVDELDSILDYMIPCNIGVTSKNVVQREARTTVKLATTTAVRVTRGVEAITDQSFEFKTRTTSAGIVVEHKKITVN